MAEYTPVREAIRYIRNNIDLVYSTIMREIRTSPFHVLDSLEQLRVGVSKTTLRELIEKLGLKAQKRIGAFG